MYRLYDSIESGEYRWPDVLAPGLFQSRYHGNRVCEGDPIENGWIRCKNATIYRNGSASAQRTVCYRPTINGCCTVDFDGQDDLLFNLDNKNIFYYGFLFGYMDSFVESGTPVAACFRTSLLTSKVMSNQSSVPLHTLRKAWNSFVRKLDIDFSSIFICRQCGPNPQITVCDGTMVGFRKDFLPVLETESRTTNDFLIEGSHHIDRIYIRIPRIRKLLLFFCGVSEVKLGNQGEKLVSKKLMSNAEYKELASLLRENSYTALASLIERLKRECKGRRILAPEPYRSFFLELELAKNTPSCGIVQISGDEELQNILLDVVKGDIDIRDSVESDHLSKMQMKAPILTRFISHFRVIPTDTRAVLLEFIGTIAAPLTTVQLPEPAAFRLDDNYQDSKLDVFPSLNQVYGLPKFKSDSLFHRENGKDTENSCRKKNKRSFFSITWDLYSLLPTSNLLWFFCNERSRKSSSSFQHISNEI